MEPFSVQTIHALAEVVTGGSANESKPPIGLYRSGPKLERFFGSLNTELAIGSSCRVAKKKHNTPLGSDESELGVEPEELEV